MPRHGKKYEAASKQVAQDPVDLKGTLQTVFMFANLWRLANVVVVGRGFSMPVLKLTGVALPIVSVLSFLWHRLSRHVSGKTFLLREDIRDI